MATAKTAIDALIKVGHDTFIAQASDPTWGTLYANMVWESKAPFFVHDNLNTIYLYKFGGPTKPQGLGTVKQWRNTRIRIDILCNADGDVQQTFEAMRTAWITDFNYAIGNGSVGQGYLRATGHIKNLEIGESRDAEWDERGIVFRQIADVQIEIGD